MPPVPIGRPNCNTTCGDVHVPYPFGFGPSGCYLPGFNLTCDACHKPPRLLLGGGNSTFQVDGIFLNNFTVRVIHDNTFDFTNATAWTDYFAGIRFPDIRRPYMLSTRNEFIVTGCNVEATLYGEYSNTTGTYDGIISSCVSNCTYGIIGLDPISLINNEYCSGRYGCCHAPIPPGSKPKKVKFRELDPKYSDSRVPAPLAFVAEEGQIDQWYMIFKRSNAYYATFLSHNLSDAYYATDVSFESTASIRLGYKASQVPIILRWVVKQHVPTSAQSDCQCKNGSYICYCKKGFYGNPYIIGGCQDIDECKIPSISDACFGECKNLDGSYKCQCPRGTRGDPHKRGGCVRILTGLQIGLLSASGPALLLLILGVNFALRRVKQQRIKLQKQKYFKQNRGQLLQQLVSQRADIAERMVVPLEELEKATNNFDQSRKLGGGGHGTVYKGILSDLHVVAIKKSKFEVHRVQREIDDFIHEVSILSQINHRNVVKLLGCCLETQVPLLVYEFISNGTLHSHLHKNDTTGSLVWKDRLRIASETAKAIAYLHSSVSIPIIHRDIKSANILLDDALTAKVSDFGASRYIPEDQNEATMTAVQGTPGYLDPMYCSTGQMKEMSDVYSFGVVLMELLTRKAPNSFQEGNGLVGEFNALLTEGNLAQILDPQVVAEGGKEVEEVASLAASCTKYKGEERPTMRQVEMALEAFQKAKDPGLENVGMRNSEGNIARNHLLTRRRTDTVEGSRQYSLEEEFLMSASFPR
ncbi:hypothetical protein EJB05_09937, partial [Eragrostis curvula]